MASSRKPKTLDPVTLEIMWTRLVSIVDEAAATLERTSFSTLVRESNDYAIVLTDARGHSLAQNTKSIPSFICTLPATVRHFLTYFPAETLKPGDALVTNDPWLGTGHKPDINVAMPIFHKGRLVAFAAAVSHMPDIGGRLRCTGVREIFEEGLHIPPAKLMDRGRPNQLLCRVIESNVRVPAQTMGDVWGLVSSCRMMERRLVGMLDETGVDLGHFGTDVQDRAERSMREAIRAVPDGTYKAEIWNDGFEDSGPILIKLALTVKKDRIDMDFAGSSPQLPKSVNVVPSYTFAYSCYGAKCVLAPEVPNNDGCYRPFTTTAPEGSILNPHYPAAVVARHVVGHLLPPVVMAALSEAVPDRVQAAPGSPGCSFNMAGEENGRAYATVSFLNGGQGASMHRDGLPTLCFPSNLSNVPIEVMENEAPIQVVQRSILPRSGGKGAQRGGDGMRFEVIARNKAPAITTCLINRRLKPAEGLMGGSAGAPGRYQINGRDTDPTEPRVINFGDRILIDTPGGGGFGGPKR